LSLEGLRVLAGLVVDELGEAEREVAVVVVAVAVAVVVVVVEVVVEVEEEGDVLAAFLVASNNESTFSPF